MNRTTIPFLALLAFLLGMVSGCTPTANKQRLAAQKRTLAREYFLAGDYVSALPLYLSLDTLDPDDPENDYAIGVSYVKLKMNLSQPYLENCIANANLYSPDLRYYAARGYHLNHHFSAAKAEYEAYQMALDTTKLRNLAATREEVDRLITQCENGLRYKAEVKDMTIKRLPDGINSEYADYGALLTADSRVLIFTSDRPQAKGEAPHRVTGDYDEDVYYCEWIDSTETWSEPKNLGPNVNTASHDASISLTPDGQKLLLYRYVQGQPWEKASGDIYISQLKGSQWSKAEPISANINSPAWEPSASISSNESLIYFSSDREGGFGGTDIYVAKKFPFGGWAEPQNVGNVINTPYDEDSPYLHPDGKTLYFSSNGHSTMGGFDIFVSHLNEETGEWGEPENLGFPINSAHDDIHFSVSADGRTVFFAAERPGSQGIDIYTAELGRPASNLMVLKGLMVDSITGKPIEASIRLTDKRTEELLGVFTSNSETGKYIIVVQEGADYQIDIESEGYELCNLTVDNTGLQDFVEVEKNIRLCPKGILPKTTAPPDPAEK